MNFTTHYKHQKLVEMLTPQDQGENGSLYKPILNDYILPEKVESKTASSVRHFTILNFNIRSLPRHYEELGNLLRTMKSEPSCIVITETWLNNLNKNLFPLPGYTCYNLLRNTGGKGGGVSIYVKDYIKVINSNLLALSNMNSEILGITLRICNLTVNIIGTYRPPNGSQLHFINQLDHLIINDLKDSQSIITGDMNIDLLNSDNQYTKDLINTMLSNGFFPSSTVPSRLNNAEPDNSTLIDQLWTNLDKCIENLYLLCDISDHLPILTIFDLRLPGSSFKSITYRVISEATQEVFLERLRSEDFTDVYAERDVNRKVEIFNHTLSDIYNAACPVKTKSITEKRLKNGWLDDNLLKSIKLKHRLYKGMIKGQIPRVTYNNYKLRLENEIRKKKRHYFHNKFVNMSGNVRETWRLINETTGLGMNKSETLPTEDVGNLAERFNTYFSSVGQNIAANLPPPSVPYDNFLHHQNNLRFQFIPISTLDVINAIGSLNNKPCGIDSIPNTFYKSCSGLIARHLAHIFNTSLSGEIYPQSLKIARVKPIYKKGDLNDLSNYRPISILPTIGKVFEKIIHDQLSTYLDLHKLLSPNQFGFRKEVSTEQANLTILEEIYKNLNEKKIILLLTLDLSKAFDSIDHDILIHKLLNLGISGPPLNWFHSYISGRMQYVNIHSRSSSLQPITHGVPQGSILGPLLFLCYINDFTNCHDVFSLQYADDTTVLLSGNTKRSIEDSANQAINQIFEWLTANKLSLNTNKTNYMIISNKKEEISVNIAINNIPLNRVNETKILGVVIDDKLTFKQHVAHVVNKLSSTTFVLHKLKLSIPRPILLKIYYALGHCHIIYCISVWGPASYYITSRVELAQKKIIRTIFNAPYLTTHTNPLFKTSKVLKFYDLLALSMSSLIHRVRYNNSPELLSLYITVNQIPHERNLRNPLNFHKPRYLLERSQRSLSHKGVDHWNKLPTDIKSTSNLLSFRRKQKTAILVSY